MIGWGQGLGFWGALGGVQVEGRSCPCLPQRRVFRASQREVGSQGKSWHGGEGAGVGAKSAKVSWWAARPGCRGASLPVLASGWTAE